MTKILYVDVDGIAQLLSFQANIKKPLTSCLYYATKFAVLVEAICFSLFFVTEFVKRSPHTSNLPTLTINDFRLITAISLKFER